MIFIFIFKSEDTTKSRHKYSRHFSTTD